VNIILFGPPGAGKGTQAQSIVKKHNYFQLSTGNLLRDEVKSKTDLGTDIEKLISNGKFVSDEIVNTLLRQALTNLKYRVQTSNRSYYIPKCLKRHHWKAYYG